jgi:hypothetical protein
VVSSNPGTLSVKRRLYCAGWTLLSAAAELGLQRCSEVPSRALTTEFAKIKIRRTRRREAFALFSAFFAALLRALCGEKVLVFLPAVPHPQSDAQSSRKMLNLGNKFEGNHLSR